MAFLFRHNEHMVILRVSQNIDPSKPLKLVLFSPSHESRRFTLNYDGFTENLIKLKNNDLMIERILSSIDEFEIFIDVNNGVTQTEPLYVAHNFLPIDFSAQKIINATQGRLNIDTYVKPGLLAVFTHAYNENYFIHEFAKYYQHLTDKSNIYIIDHGSDEKYKNEYKKTGCNLISIPRQSIDHFNIKQYVEYFQRFLLTQYQWVIHVDSDEILVHKKGAQAFIAFLETRKEKIIIKPSTAFEVIQNPKTEHELLPHIPFGSQRDHLIESPDFKKPVLASTACTWSIGFHNTYNDTVSVSSDEFTLLHLKYISVNETTRRNANWANAIRSHNDIATNITYINSPTDREEIKNKLLERLLSNKIYTKNEILELKYDYSNYLF